LEQLKELKIKGKNSQSPVKNFIIFKQLEQARRTVSVFLSDLGLVGFAHPRRWAEAI